MYKRPPIASGKFYPGTRGELQKTVEDFLVESETLEPAIGIVAPHAGYVFSGRTAGLVYAQVEIPPVVLIMAPNHTGEGIAIGGASIVSSGSFITPMGGMHIDEQLAGSLKASCDLVKEDQQAHDHEHSLEAQLPFLQVTRPDVRLVPLIINYDDPGPASIIGSAIARAVKDFEDEVLLVASSDMTHYKSRAIASELDRLAIERVENLDPVGLLKVTREKGITMCGRAPVATMLVAARELGASEARLVDYSDSGDAFGDTNSVVGYAGIVVR